MSGEKKRIFLGGMAVIFYIAHGSTWLQRGVPAGLLWACHLGCLMVGVALLADVSFLNAIGVQWLVLGNILWFLDLAGGGEFIHTSPLTHLGGLLIGLCYAHQKGFPRGSWWAALSGLAALHFISGIVSPRAENINLACAVNSNWKRTFPDFWTFRLFLLAVSAALFYGLERALRRWWIKQGGQCA